MTSRKIVIQVSFYRKIVGKLVGPPRFVIQGGNLLKTSRNDHNKIC